MRRMTHTDIAREAARESNGRFGVQEHSSPETEIASVSTYDIPVDELNVGDTFLHEGEQLTVHESWVLGVEPETRVVATDRGDIRLERESRVDVVRTGNEPTPEDDPDFDGYCHRCGQAFARDVNGVTSHIHPRGGKDYDEDENHTPYALEDWAIGFGEDV